MAAVRAGLAPEDHTHAIADVTGLQGALDARAPRVHGHDAGAIAGLGSAVLADTGAFATAAQRALAESAVQPGTLAAVATTGAYADLAGPPYPGLGNLLINGGCRISQRGEAPLSIDWTPSPVDLFAVRLEDAQAGTAKRRTTSSLARTGWYLLAEAVSAGAGGVLCLRQRIEADDAWVMEGAPAAFRCRVWHDLGGARSLRVTLSAPTGRDDFTARTQLAQATLSIPATQEHDAVVAFPLLAGCGNGLEVEIALDCPHAASAWIGLGDLQLTRGGEPAPFAFTPIGVDAARVARQLRTLSTATGRANSGSTLQLLLSHPAMRAAPRYVATAPLRVTDSVTADWIQSQASIGTVHDHDPHGGRVDVGFFSGLPSGAPMAMLTTGGVILASAEL